jgi:hypothetical protein
MNQGRRVKKIFQCKPEGSTRKGRPRFKWLEVVEKDLRGMKVKKWRQKAVDRKELASVIGRPRVPEGRRTKESVSN